MSMKAIVYEQYGAPLELKEYRKPTPAADEVLVRVKAAGVNPVDWKLATGGMAKMWPSQLPIIPGWDVAGVVEAVGSDAQQSFQAGDEVFGYIRPEFDLGKTNELIADNGSYAEYVAVGARKLAHKPKKSDFAQAAGWPLAGLTSWQALFEHGKIASGQSVVVLNASGGTGSCAVQFAKSAGCFVVGTCSGRNVEYVKQLGADAVVDYTAGDVIAGLQAVLPGGAADVVYDCVGGESTGHGLAVLKSSGVIVSIANWGMAQQAEAQGKRGVAFLVRPSAEQLREIASRLDAGTLAQPTVQTFGLAEATKAWDASKGGRTQGKLVLVVE